ncbi:MAG TPA: glycosyltransferase family 9 protein [Puia sp.]|jgi:heptosyltransferase-2|nr:glycosyltransferase family 9 protein [Puia sp.]
MKKNLIIKTGAAGDVVRTTVLLNALPEKITWLVDEKYIDILPRDHPHLEKIISIQNAEELLSEEFDLIISLEENLQCAMLASKIVSKKITGVYFADNNLKYTEDSAGWFDISLISSKGFAIANTIKSRNTLSFQYLLFNMVGLSFRGEPYCIYKDENIFAEEKLIGIEKRSGNRWPNKSWYGYDQLAENLSKQGFKIKLLTERNSIKDYLNDIAACNYIISGDTLAMHVALAYNKPCVAIFNCTSPDEIYDYGILKKIISPLLKKVFYQTNFDESAITAVKVEEVESAFRSLLY